MGIQRNRRGWQFGACIVSMWALAAWADEAPPAEGKVAGPAGKETNCTDRKDDDGDGLVDCADRDCAADPACKPGSGAENSNAACSDWFDNDGDGFIDCDDPDCEGAGITVCKGSWKEPAPAGGGAAVNPDEMPELGPGQTVEDLFGKAGDIDGERNDEVCSDGVDNDGDGRIDCADFGCRFDPDVSVCRGNPGVRFGMAGRLEGGMYLNDKGSGATLTSAKTYDMRFSTLSVRALGPAPLVQNSFFIISAHLDGTPRATFAMLQLPLANGHFFSLNSGGASLSSSLLSFGRVLLLDTAYYMTNAFEQPTGGSAEVWGPLAQGLTYRVFALAGNGSYGVIGALSSTNGNAVSSNFPFGVGGMIGANLIGTMSRFDSQLLYSPVPTAVHVSIGGKFEQRTNERYPVVHMEAKARSGRFYGKFEGAFKREIDYGANAFMYNLTFGALLIPKRLILGVDFGSFVADDYKIASTARTDINRQRDEQQWRVALHAYVWKTVGVATLLYRDDALQGTIKDPQTHIREATANFTFRF